MGLKAIFMNTTTMAADPAASPKSKADRSDKSFDSFLERADRKDAGLKQVEREKSKPLQPQKKEESRLETNEPAPKAPDRADNGAGTETESVTEPVEKEVLKAGTTTKPDVSKEEAADFTDNDAVLMQELSAVLQLPVEMLLNVLTELQMSPADLADPGNLNLFMQKAYNADSPLQLLEIPNIGQAFKAAAELLKNHLPESPQPGILQPEGQQTDGASATKLAETNSPVTMENSQALQGASAQSVHPVEVQATMKGSGMLMQQQVKDAVPVSNPTLPEQEPAQAERLAQFSATANQDMGGGGDMGESEGDTQADIEQQFLTNLINTAPLVKDSVQSVQMEIRKEAASTINTQDVVNHLVERLKVDVRENVSEIRITLRPEHLGDVSLKVVTENGIVTAQFVAESQRIKEIIESNASLLKNALQEQGISLSSLSVSVGQDKNQERMDNFLRNQQEQMRGARRLNNLQSVGLNTDEEVAYADPMDAMEYSINYTA